MKETYNIRQLYKPIQPAVKESAGAITYLEFLPESKLQNFIYCYWELKTTKILQAPFNYRVVSDGCIDIFFELNKPAENFVMGFSKKYTEFLLTPSFHYIGVRFLPAAFPQLFCIKAADLSNRFEELENVVPDFSKFITDNFSKNLTVQEIKSLFDSYFFKKLACTDFTYDHRLYEAIEIILKNSGDIKVTRDLNTGISQRQLRRLFKFYIGDNAKTFSKVVRFQNMLKTKSYQQNLEQNKLFFDAGYYDQAHFIKEFKNFYGVTPGQAFENG